MKLKKLVHFICGICEEEYSFDYYATRCEEMHGKLERIVKVGAKVHWNESIADIDSYVNGVVVGFTAEGKLIVKASGDYKAKPLRFSDAREGWVK